MRRPREYDTLARVCLHVLLVTISLFMLLPFAWMVGASLKSGQDVFASVFLPSGDGWLGVAWSRLSADNFVRLFRGAGFGRAMLYSTFYASVTAVGGTLGASLCGYALAKFSFCGRRLLTAVVLGAVLVPGPLLFAPGYQVLYRLGLMDSYAGLILPALVPAVGVFLFRQAMIHGVPDELLDAARIDGAGEVRIFFSIVMPMIRPMLGAFLLITFLGAWNNFIGPQVVLQRPEIFPLTTTLTNLRGSQYQDWGLVMAGTLVSILPMMGLFLLLQRDFIQGLTAGAVKH
jgi:ABC-type glycerol-3-phosphate transport system permease component